MSTYLLSFGEITLQALILSVPMGRDGELTSLTGKSYFGKNFTGKKLKRHKQIERVPITTLNTLPDIWLSEGAFMNAYTWKPNTSVPIGIPYPYPSPQATLLPVPYD